VFPLVLESAIFVGSRASIIPFPYRHRPAGGLQRPGGSPPVAVEADGIPLAVVPALANRRDDGLLAATLDAIAVIGPLPAQPVVHRDAGYDDQPCRQVLAERGMAGQIATRGMPAPIKGSRRWVIERTHAWGNRYGKLRWCTERRRTVVELWLTLASAVVVCGRLLRRAWTPTGGTVALPAAHERLSAQPADVPRG
jgi:hypothetical protein